MSKAYGFLLEFIPYMMRGRNDIFRGSLNVLTPCPLPYALREELPAYLQSL